MWRHNKTASLCLSLQDPPPGSSLNKSNQAEEKNIWCVCYRVTSRRFCLWTWSEAGSSQNAFCSAVKLLDKLCRVSLQSLKSGSVTKNESFCFCLLRTNGTYVEMMCLPNLSQQTILMVCSLNRNNEWKKEMQNNSHNCEIKQTYHWVINADWMCCELLLLTGTQFN